MVSQQMARAAHPSVGGKRHPSPPAPRSGDRAERGPDGDSVGRPSTGRQAPPRPFPDTGLLLEDGTAHLLELSGSLPSQARLPLPGGGGGGRVGGRRPLRELGRPRESPTQTRGDLGGVGTSVSHVGPHSSISNITLRWAQARNSA